MAQPNHTPRLVETEEALSVLFCLVDDACAHLNPHARSYESLKRLADSEVITLALFQQLRGTESERSFERSFLRDAQRFPGAAWVRWGSFSVYGVKLHLLCAASLVPISYELTPANVADVSVTEELLAEAALGEGVARRLLGDLAYRSEQLREALAEMGILPATERSERRRGVRPRRAEIAISSLKRVFGLGETLASTLVGLATRIAAKMTYTYAYLVNRVLGCPQGKIKALWA